MRGGAAEHVDTVTADGAGVVDPSCPDSDVRGAQMGFTEGRTDVAPPHTTSPGGGVADRLDDARLARRLAESAGRVLLELRREQADLEPAALKAAGDERSQQHLAAELERHRPADAVLSEEAADDASRLGADRVWIIDPLDGTREFREGRDDWAVHVALVADGRVLAAAVSQPARDDVFDTAPVTSGTPLPPPVAASARRVVISRSRPPRCAQAVADALGATLWQVGSAGAKALTVVRGEALAYVHEGGMNEWDAAAPVGVALAHGLHVSDLHGEAIVFNQRDVVLHGGLVICRKEIASTLLDAV